MKIFIYTFILFANILVYTIYDNEFIVNMLMEYIFDDNENEIFLMLNNLIIPPTLLICMMHKIHNTSVIMLFQNVINVYNLFHLPLILSYIDKQAQRRVTSIISQMFDLCESPSPKTWENTNQISKN